jgi:von Willebrand factor type A domain/Aerotolerance regulator N-terminal
MAKPIFNSRPRMQGVWFPLCLALLLLLTIPGVVLLLINLLGQQGPVNGWLRDKLSLTYNILLPWWGALLLLLLPFLIVLLYFLKMKRKPLQVPSTFLWRKAIEDLHVNSLFQWLRDNVLLLIQLLIVLLLIYSAMSFQVHHSGTTGRHYILILDNSASMSATDVQPNRLEVARLEALQEIDRHDDEDHGMVIEFNSRAAILQTYINDKGLLRNAVRRIQQTQRPTRIEEALSLAESLANPRNSTDNQASRPAEEDPAKARTYVAGEGVSAEVHLFSDGGFSDGTSFAAGNLDLHYHRIGSPGPVDNVGIVTLKADRDPLEPTKVTVFARVLNFRKERVATKLELETRIQGRKEFGLKSKEVNLDARTVTPADPKKNQPLVDTPGEAVVSFELPDMEEGVAVLLHARLVGLRDAFPLDDEAWVVLGVVRKARVLIVSPDTNDILRYFFDQEATRKVANVTYLTPGELEDDAKYGKPARDESFDLVIFDRCAPKKEENLPRANTFFIDNVPPPWNRAAMKPLEGVQIRHSTSKHPLMRSLTVLDEITFGQAFRFEYDPPKNPNVPPRMRLLETDKETSVLFALNRGSFTDLVLAFPLVKAKGEWPTKLSFPLFLWNVLYQLGNVSDSSAEESTTPGEVRIVRPDAPVKQIEVTIPGEGAAPQLVQRTPQGQFAVTNTERLGVYTAKWDGGEQTFAVNLLDAEESNIEPREAVQVGATSLPAGPSRGQPRETWKWWALAALLLLALEWIFYHRRYS